jgi:hypothetical protein
MPPLRGLLFPFAAATALWACSSSIELKPLDEPATSEGETAPPDETSSTETASAVPAGQAGDQNSSEQLPNPTFVNPGGSGGSNGGVANGSAGTAPMMAAMGGDPMGSDPMGNSAAGTGGSNGTPACPDTDGDGKCDAVDACPNDRDDGSDRDGNGVPDACDRCGIGFALGLSPLFYFALDETVASSEALNLGSVRENGTYVGPIEHGWAGVAHPQGRAPRFLGELDGAFSRVELLNVPAFPSTALTAMFWVRTSQTGDFVVISYAIQGSSNEFAVIVERDRLIVTLQSSTFQAIDIDRNRITDGTWHFVALTWDSKQAQYYFDGEAVGAPLITQAGYEIAESVSVPVTGPLSLSPGGVLVLGQDQDSLDGDFSFEQALVGGLDEVAIYDRVLSSDQIRTIYTATTCGERCDGIDNDGDGKVDEGFLGSSPACPASSCGEIAATSGFGPGDYFSRDTPTVPLTCYF